MVGRQPSPLAGAPDRRADCVISATLRIVLRRRQELQTATRVAPITLCVALRACVLPPCAVPLPREHSVDAGRYHRRDMAPSVAFNIAAPIVSTSTKQA